LHADAISDRSQPDKMLLLTLLLMFFTVNIFQSTTLLTGMTGISLHRAMAPDFSVAWQYSRPQQQLAFRNGSDSTPLSNQESASPF
jgi:hypothetical protein